MGGHNNWMLIINLGNSIIGVAVLAMPFCFQQCGILLSMLVLLFCTWLTLASCKLLMSAGVTSRRRSYEFLAYHTHGATGKFITEVNMIGMQLGTLIAQTVVIGDLGPAIISKVLGIENTSGLRTALIILLCMTVGLPLGLLKDLRAVSRASTVCITFYCVFILYVCLISVPNLWTGAWYPKVYFWRFEGLFQCLPILSFSFGCQTQLFLAYDALPEPSLKAISGVISSAVNLCAVAYLLVGFFGYIAFYQFDIPGDVISVFPSTFFADIMKLCFVFSIVITFPVIIFPCRASIYTLLFSKRAKGHDDVLSSESYIPEKPFKVITITIVVGSMITAILIPNVEFVLGINGAIMGTLICYIFPALFFLKVMNTKPDGKNIAKLVLLLGVTILLVSTFATLSSQDKGHTHIKKPEDLLLKEKDIVSGQVENPLASLNKKAVEDMDKDTVKEKEAAVEGDIRKEPPNPDPPKTNLNPKPPEDSAVKDTGQENDKGVNHVQGDTGVKDKRDLGDKDDVDKNVKVEGADVGDKKQVDMKDFVKEEESKAKEKEQDRKQQELIQQLEKHRDEQEQLLEEQRKLLKEFKEHHNQDMQKEQQQKQDSLQQVQPKQEIGQQAQQQGQQLPVQQPAAGENIAHNQQFQQAQVQQPVVQQQVAQHQAVAQQQQPAVGQQQHVVQKQEQNDQLQQQPGDQQPYQAGVQQPAGGAVPIQAQQKQLLDQDQQKQQQQLNLAPKPQQQQQLGQQQQQQQLGQQQQQQQLGQQQLGQQQQQLGQQQQQLGQQQQAKVGDRNVVEPKPGQLPQQQPEQVQLNQGVQGNHNAGQAKQAENFQNQQQLPGQEQQQQAVVRDRRDADRINNNIDDKQAAQGQGIGTGNIAPKVEAQQHAVGGENMKESVQLPAKDVVVQMKKEDSVSSIAKDNEQNKKQEEEILGNAAKKEVDLDNGDKKKLEETLRPRTNEEMRRKLKAVDLNSDLGATVKENVGVVDNPQIESLVFGTSRRLLEEKQEEKGH